MGWHAACTRAQPLTRGCHAWTRTQVVRIHTHIGSGSDPAVWQRVRRESITLRQQVSHVKLMLARRAPRVR